MKKTHKVINILNMLENEKNRLMKLKRCKYVTSALLDKRKQVAEYRDLAHKGITELYYSGGKLIGMGKI
jgi:hypothetical protein